MTELNIIETVKEKPATVVEMAVLNFVGDDELSGMSDKELAECSRKRADEVYTLTYLALGMLRLDKDKLVGSIRESRRADVWMDFLEQVEYGQEVGQMLVGFCKSASARLLVALATVEQERGPDGDGGEPLPVETIAA